MHMGTRPAQTKLVLELSESPRLTCDSTPSIAGGVMADRLRHQKDIAVWVGYCSGHMGGIVNLA